ncbi:hypothetical protein [Kutzneria sp. CA-103260]|uniref:hypothetical protein n=1 Tax=Kutzneria sp. CA-103260 TaxID=2802641 RepID=UPI001BAB0EBD|nr:hypothetical protein [Kutzneria sp. CA-103260]QUQ64590.1 hypothetical protein JJ691_23100 [Kutzneria sp. CA-103260]
MSAEVDRLLVTWDRFTVALRMNEGFNGTAYAELRSALTDLTAAWQGMDALPRLGVNVLVDIVPTVDAMTMSYPAPTSSKIGEAVFELQELIAECVALSEQDVEYVENLSDGSSDSDPSA